MMRAMLAALVLCTACQADDGAIALSRAEYRWGGTGDFSTLTDLEREPPGRNGAERLEVCYDVPPLSVPDPALIRAGASTVVSSSVDGHPAQSSGAVLPLGAPDRAHRACLMHEAWYPLASHSVRAGSERHLVRHAQRRELPPFTLGLVFGVLGLVLMASSLRRGAARLYRFVGTLAFSLALVSVSQAVVLRSLLFESHWRWLTAAGLAAAPASAVLFVRDTVGDTAGGWLRRVALATLLAIFVLALLDALHLAPLQDSYRVIYVFVLIATVVVVRHLARTARSGDRSARTLLFGLGALVVISIPDIVSGLDLAGHAANGFTSLGLLVFFLFVGYAVEGAYRGQRDRLEQTAVTLRRQVTELEERGHEIETLNEELRHQLERRSRELSNALSSGRGLGTSTGALTRGAVVDARYRVESRLGAGAMGAVYECTRLTDERPVAVKVMTGILRSEQAQRFAREAEIAAKVRHENLVPLVDVGIAPEGFLYLVMELVRGNTLEDERDRFGNVDWGLPLLADVARGLVALHEAKIVHRDLKPSNVLLDRRGTNAVRARIADFGIARPDESPALAATVDVNSNSALTATAPAALTKTGALVGTPLYMPPEAARGESSLASDVFALGVVVHEVLACEYPFASPPVLGARVGQREALRLSPRLPPSLSALVREALHPEPLRRPAAGDVLTVLEQLHSWESGDGPRRV